MAGSTPPDSTPNSPADTPPNSPRASPKASPWASPKISPHNALPDAETLALIALAYVAADEELLPRFLALSGLDLDDLRARAQDPAMLGAVLDFLLAHEPDLIRFAELQEISPAAIARARHALPGAAVED